MGRFTKRILLGLIATVALLVAALLIAPQFIPVEVYKHQIVKQGEAVTGRKIAVNGDISLRFLPRVQLLLEDVHVGNPKDFDADADKDFLSLKALHLSLSFFDLLNSRILIDRFELVDPVIALEKNAGGQANWEFDVSPKTTDAPKTEAERETASRPSDSPGLAQIQVPALRIVNGSISYTEPGKEPIRLSKLDADIEAPALASPATLTLSTLYGKDFPVKLIARINTPQKWLDGQEVALSLQAAAGSGEALTEAGFDGTVRQEKDGAPAALGAVKANSVSLKALGKALGVTLLPDNLKGKGELRFSAKATYAGSGQTSGKTAQDALTLDDLTLGLDNLTLAGNASIKPGDRPSVKAVLSSPDVLVVDALFTPPATGDNAGSAPAQTPSSTGWSKEPVLADTGFLKAAEADVKLSLGGVKYDRLTLGALSLHAVLQQGTLAVNIGDFDFYEGKANAAFSLSAPAKTAAITGKATLSSINAGKFLTEFQGFDKLEGKGNIALSLNTSGASLHDFVNRLGGSGSVRLADGAVKGINIAETVRNARNLLSGKGASAADAAAGVRTDFAELGGSFTIAQGIVTNNDLSLKAPLLTLTGQGTVNLPQQRVDYRLRPTVVTTLEGQGRTAGARDALTIPLRVSGTFERLSFTPDLEDTLKSTVKDALQDPGKAKEDLKNIKSGIKGLLKGL